MITKNRMGKQCIKNYFTDGARTSLKLYFEYVLFCARVRIPSKYSFETSKGIRKETSSFSCLIHAKAIFSAISASRSRIFFGEDFIKRCRKTRSSGR